MTDTTSLPDILPDTEDITGYPFSTATFAESIAIFALVVSLLLKFT